MIKNSKAYFYKHGKIYEDYCCMFPKTYGMKECETCDVREVNDSMDEFQMFIRLGNRCNCKCVMCTDSSCHNFGELHESKEYEDFYMNKIEEGIKSNLKVLSVVGGETLLYREQLFKIIDMIKDTDIFFALNTNVSIYDEELIEYIFSNIKNLVFITSIDAYESNNIIRVGSPNIDKIISNYKKIYLHKKFDTQKIVINTVISKLNIDVIVNEYEKLINSISTDCIDRTMFTILIYPKSLKMEASENNVNSLISLMEVLNKYNIEYEDRNIKNYILRYFLGESW